MKRYKEYMDGVVPSDTLKKKLEGLEPPKKTGRGKWYGIAAAVVAVVVCLGAVGLHRGIDGGLMEGPEIGRPEPGEPMLDPNLLPDATTEIAGGYQVIEGETVGYCYLPAIHYGQVEPMAADWAPPFGVSRYDLTEAELLALFPGEQDLTGHLNWGGYTLSAHAMLRSDDTLWMLTVCGSGDTPFDHFELNVMPGGMPPSCIVYPNEKVNEIWGAEVTAAIYESDRGSVQQVSFMHNGYGYRFELQTSGGDLDDLVPRLVRYVILGQGFSGEGADTDVPSGGGDEVSTPPYEGNAEAATDPYGQNGWATTEPYDPNGGN